MTGRAVAPVLSAVVTCYADAPAIAPMHARLTDVFESLNVNYEIIFVNDGSPDDAGSILRRLTAEDDRVLAIEHSRNFGSQSAFASGMQLAAGDAVVLLDGDLQDPPELIRAFYAKWREGNDVVYGRRVKREGQPLLGLFSRAFYRLFRGLSDVPMPVDAGDFALMDRRVVSELLALPETDLFLRGLRAWVGFTQTGIDYVRPRRAFGRSTHSRLKLVWWACKAIFSFSFVPIEVLGYLAALLTPLSLGSLAYLVVGIARHPERTPGVFLVIAAVAFFGSLNLLAVALVGQYVIKIVEETKRRPRFIRKAIVHRGEIFATRETMDGFLARRARTVAGRTGQTNSECRSN